MHDTDPQEAGSSDPHSMPAADMQDRMPAGTRDPSLWRIRRILDSSLQEEEREQAVRALLPRLWSRLPWERYGASCSLTTRIYIPFGLHLLEWSSFPSVFLRALRRRGFSSLPTTHEIRRTAVALTLGNMLTYWIQDMSHGKSVSMYNGADMCDAAGRLGITEAEEQILQIVDLYAGSNNQVKMAAMLALASLPPARLTRFWRSLQQGTPQQRRGRASVLAYMANPAAVPFIIETISCQETADHHENVTRPALNALGTIGDPRALPVLNVIARDESHTQRATAQKAIRRLMKEAQGSEEVTLVRASGMSSMQQDVLLRPASDSSNRHAEDLLRPSSEQERDQ